MITTSQHWILIAAFALLFAASACKKKDDNKSKKKPKAVVTTPTKTLEAQATKIADKMCACKDEACATKVLAEYKKWGAKQKLAMAETKALMTKINPITTRLAKCHKKLKTGGSKAAFVEVKGDFKTPESVFYDAAADIYLVSNINGTPFAIDDNGFISQVTPDGKVSNLYWIDGRKKDVELNAPKGMAILAGVLYVADVTVVRMFDRKTGAAKGTIKIPGSTFLNDVVAGKGVVYVSDSGKKAGFANSGTDAVWQIKGGKATALIKDAKLGNPNGLLVLGDDVWVVNFGNAELYKVTGGKKASVTKLPKGGLDGIARMNGGDLLISSWQGKAVYRGPVTGPFKAIAKNIDTPADLGFDSKRNRLLVPLFGKHVVRIYTVTDSKPPAK